MNDFSAFRKKGALAAEEVDNSGCAHPGCYRAGTICFTTHPGPTTSWFCGDHAFPDQRTAKPKKVEEQTPSSWLIARGVISGAEGLEERLRKLAAYRKQLARTPTVAKAEPRAWAGEVLSRIAEGHSYPPHIEKMAREALGINYFEGDAA